MANGVLTRRITRMSDDNALTQTALREQPLDDLVGEIFRRLLTRDPSETERVLFSGLLSDGYDRRRIAGAASSPTKPDLRRGTVSWSNHLNPEANVIKTELEAAVREGDPPTARLESNWRERLEDMTWALINSPEFVFLP
jgi:hypothetical protein